MKKLKSVKNKQNILSKKLLIRGKSTFNECTWTFWKSGLLTLVLKKNGIIAKVWKGDEKKNLMKEANSFVWIFWMKELLQRELYVKKINNRSRNLLWFKRQLLERKLITYYYLMGPLKCIMSDYLIVNW